MWCSVVLLPHDLAGVESVYADQVQLFPYYVPTASPLHGREDGVRNTGKQRAPILVD